MSKIKLTEGDLRKLVNESIKELIDEGVFGGLLQNAWDTTKQGIKNDWNNIKDNWNNISNYNTNKKNSANKDAVTQYYGEPCIQNPQKNNSIPSFVYIKDRSGYDFIMGENEFKDGNGNIITNANQYYAALKNRNLYINDNEMNNPLYKNVVKQYYNPQTNMLNNNTSQQQFAKAIRDYRLKRTQVWEDFEEELLINLNNNSRNNNQNNNNPLAQ